LTGNVLVRADAVRACELLEDDLRFDLVYLDPPYGLGVEMAARTQKGEARGRRQSASGPAAYDDLQPVAGLVSMLTDVARTISTKMAKGALFCLHMDHRAVHEAKIAMDGVFGAGAFAGEIIWAPGNGARGRGFSTTHQTILLYARKPSERKLVRWRASDPALREPYASTSLSMHFRNRDEDGRLYRERAIGGKTYRYYADEGRRMGSVWSDIPAMVANTPILREGTGYPTQKPERLLERIILAASDEGDTVADLMCGSGTTLAVAARLGRRFVGADASPLALSVTVERLKRGEIPFCYAPLE
jgi:site-specific DNA-methyltransferase (adenine-specific)